jgi:inner membrane protein
MKNAFFLKILSLGFVGFLLFVFLIQIQHIIYERQTYKSQAINGIASANGGPQTVIGPMIHMVCSETWLVPPPPKKKDEEQASAEEERRDFVLTSTAQTLNIKANAQVEPRSRGLHQTNIYTNKTVINASWDRFPKLQPQAERKDSKVRCAAPILMLGLSDSNGIRNATVKLNTQTLKFNAGTLHPTYKTGLHLTLPENFQPTGAQPLMLEIELELAGIEKLAVVPLAENVQMRMQSNWPHPSFAGRFAPSQRSVNTQVFDASWRVTELASNAAQGIAEQLPICSGNEHQAQEKCIGVMYVGFVEPINFYSLSDRASKYGLLFIALTFVALGLFEVMKQLRVHPLQYLLAGAAICTFFLLLVSLSEHIGFTLAYASGAAATVLLLTYYARFMLGSWARSLPFGLGMGLLYSMLYVLLQLEQTALAVGSVGLFVVLAVVMVCTRKIDWYALLSSPASPQAAADDAQHLAQNASQDTLWKDEK